MAKVLLSSTPLVESSTDAIAAGGFQDVPVAKQTLRTVDQRFNGLVARLVDERDFRGRFKEVRFVRLPEGSRAPRLFLIGLGKRAKYTLDALREAAARAALAARDHRLRTLTLELPPPKGAGARVVGRAIAESVAMALFDYREYKSEPGEDEDPKVAMEEVRVVEPRAGRREGVRAGLTEGVIGGDAVNLARTLIVRPSIAKAPQALAAVAAQEAKAARVRATILGPPQLRKLGMGALLGVGQGSVRPPRLVVLEYKGRGRKRVLLAGKGITFDSGGINIKPSDGMERMKYDMAGSATVLATLVAAARLRLPVQLVGILALAENMPSGAAIRPGDVLRAYNKKTIEVANTDAEGRLVLADALSYGVERFRPDFVVDVATLTGAARIALGNITTCIIGSNQPLVARLIAAGQRTGDDLWQLPLHKGYEKQVQSEIADVRNTGSGGAGAIAGAAFLKQFVGDRAWAHLDIAGTCWTEKGPGELNKEYLPKGPTGIGVRLLLEWLRGL